MASLGSKTDFDHTDSIETESTGFCTKKLQEGTQRKKQRNHGGKGKRSKERTRRREDRGPTTGKKCRWLGWELTRGTISVGI